VLLMPVVLFWSALTPLAVLLSPVVLLASAFTPRAVFDGTAPEPYDIKPLSDFTGPENVVRDILVSFIESISLVVFYASAGAVY